METPATKLLSAMNLAIQNWVEQYRAEYGEEQDSEIIQRKDEISRKIASTQLVGYTVHEEQDWSPAQFGFWVNEKMPSDTKWLAFELDFAAHSNCSVSHESNAVIFNTNSDLVIVDKILRFLHANQADAGIAPLDVVHAVAMTRASGYDLNNRWGTNALLHSTGAVYAVAQAADQWGVSPFTRSKGEDALLAATGMDGFRSDPALLSGNIKVPVVKETSLLTPLNGEGQIPGPGEEACQVRLSVSFYEGPNTESFIALLVEAAKRQPMVRIEFSPETPDALNILAITSEYIDLFMADVRNQILVGRTQALT